MNKFQAGVNLQVFKATYFDFDINFQIALPGILPKEVQSKKYLLFRDGIQFMGFQGHRIVPYLSSLPCHPLPELSLKKVEPKEPAQLIFRKHARCMQDVGNCSGLQPRRKTGVFRGFKFGSDVKSVLMFVIGDPENSYFMLGSHLSANSILLILDQKFELLSPSWISSNIGCDIRNQ